MQMSHLTIILDAGWASDHHFLKEIALPGGRGRPNPGWPGFELIRALGDLGLFFPCNNFVLAQGKKCFIFDNGMNGIHEGSF